MVNCDVISILLYGNGCLAVSIKNEEETWATEMYGHVSKNKILKKTETKDKKKSERYIL